MVTGTVACALEKPGKEKRLVATSSIETNLIVFFDFPIFFVIISSHLQGALRNLSSQSCLVGLQCCGDLKRMRKWANKRRSLRPERSLALQLPVDGEQQSNKCPETICQTRQRPNSRGVCPPPSHP